MCDSYVFDTPELDDPVCTKSGVIHDPARHGKGRTSWKHRPPPDFFCPRNTKQIRPVRYEVTTHLVIVPIPGPLQLVQRVGKGQGKPGPELWPDGIADRLDGQSSSRAGRLSKLSTAARSSAGSETTSDGRSDGRGCDPGVGSLAVQPSDLGVESLDMQPR